MDLTQHANSAYIWLQRTDWWRVQKYLFNTSYVATLTWAGDGEETTEMLPSLRMLLIYVEKPAEPWGTERPVKDECDGWAVDGGSDEGWGRGEDRRRPGDFLGPAWAGRSQLYTAEPEDLSSEHRAPEAPLLEKVGGDAQRRACMEMVGAGGAWLGRAIRALNVVRFLSAGFRDSPLSFMFCSPSTARPGVNLFTYV